MATVEVDEDPLVEEPTLLKALLKARHWQKRETFSSQWDRVAKTLDSSLVGTCPAHAQFYRWLSGNVRGMPHPDACRILEAMFPGLTVQRLFRPVRARRSELLDSPPGQLAASDGSAPPASPSALPATSSADTAHVEAAQQDVGHSAARHESKRRDTIKLGLAVAVTPEVLGRVLSDAAAEAMEFTQLTALSAVGRGTLDHLELVISDLNRAYMTNPPTEQFIAARAYRSRVDELIRGRHTLKELQELYVHAAWLSELLALLAHDLGSSRTGQAYALDSYTYANEAGHGELCGWAADAMATITMYSGHPDRAAEAAMRCVAKVSASHPLAVRLHAHAARAYARLGQREPCETLFSEAQQLYERLPARAPCRFTIDTGILASYAMTGYPASAYTWLGDFKAARTHAEAALAVHESASLDSSSPSREAIVRIDLAMALAHLGTPDEAVVLGGQALTSTRVVTSVLLRARDLDKALVNRYPRLACVREFHEQYRQVVRPSTIAEEGL
jgi:tetratricopeptide (TPR) repeat protein